MSGYGGVSLSDYTGMDFGGGGGVLGGDSGFSGIASRGDVDALNKALSAGADIDNPGAAAGQGFPLRVESLDKTLFVTTYRAKDVKFWKSLYKDAAYNTVEEFNRLESYGSGEAAFIAEGDLATEDDSLYSRQYTQVKYMGTTRRVTHVMSLVRPAHGNVVARETVNGTLWLLRQLERALFGGDSDLVPVQFDGLEKLLISAWGNTRQDDDQLSGYEDATNVIDLRGSALTEDHIADAAERIIREPNFGAPSDLWLPTGPMKDLSKIMYPKERYDLPAPSGGKAGIAIKSIVTPFGDIALNPDVFIPDSVVPSGALGPAAQRPNAPTVGALTSPAYAGSGLAQFAAADAGNYIYKIVAANRYGRSAPVTTPAVAVTAGDQVSIPLTDNGPNTTYYIVYRSALNGAAGTCREIMRIRRTGATQTAVDLNRFLPNCSKGYMLTQTPEVLKWKQLAPFAKIPLATIDTSVRWMQVLYGALQVQKPLQAAMFINIGKLQTGAEAV